MRYGLCLACGDPRDSQALPVATSSCHSSDHISELFSWVPSYRCCTGQMTPGLGSCTENFLLLQEPGFPQSVRFGLSAQPHAATPTLRYHHLDSRAWLPVKCSANQGAPLPSRDQCKALSPSLLPSAPPGGCGRHFEPRWSPVTGKGICCMVPAVSQVWPQVCVQQLGNTLQQGVVRSCEAEDYGGPSGQEGKKQWSGRRAALACRGMGQVMRVCQTGKSTSWCWGPALRSCISEHRIRASAS